MLLVTILEVLMLQGEREEDKIQYNKADLAQSVSNLLLHPKYLSTLIVPTTANPASEEKQIAEQLNILQELLSEDEDSG